ncbi:MAG TPA: DUF4864 domain-containing protein [Opitutaceae bacterium]|nr:DUF4864 domain-containing protein [Opitutaceae bacterium]
MRVFFWLLLGLVLTVSSRAVESNLHYSAKTLRLELIHNVQGQLAAFREEDFKKALTFAAKRLREQYDATSFATLVKQGYPVIAKNGSAEFGLSKDDGDIAILVVTVVAKDGKRVDYNYGFIRESEAWKIAAVLIDKAKNEI